MNDVTVSYSAVQVGKRQLKATIQVTREMAGITSGDTGNTIDRFKLLALVKQYVKHAHRVTDDVSDLHIKVCTATGFVDELVLKFGFMPEHVLEQVVPMQSTIEPVTGMVTDLTVYSKALSADQIKDHYKASKMGVPADDAPESELTPKQRRYRQELAQRAEDEAFASYSRKHR